MNCSCDCSGRQLPALISSMRAEMHACTCAHLLHLHVRTCDTSNREAALARARHVLAYAHRACMHAAAPFISSESSAAVRPRVEYARECCCCCCCCCCVLAKNMAMLLAYTCALCSILCGGAMRMVGAGPAQPAGSCSYVPENSTTTCPTQFEQIAPPDGHCLLNPIRLFIGLVTRFWCTDQSVWCSVLCWDSVRF